MSLRDEILALPDDLLAARNDVAVAAALSVGRTRIVPTQVGKGAIIETIGLTAANAMLDVIDNAPDYRHVRQLLANGWFNVGSHLVRAALDALVPAILTQDQVVALKALAEIPDPVSASDVALILNAEKV